MIRITTLTMVAALLALPGCRKPPAPQRPNEPPEAAVRELFKAFAAKNCPQVEARMGGAFAKRYRKKGGCAKLLTKDPLAKAKLIRLVSTVTDGRSKLRHTVKFVLGLKGREMEVTAQVEWRQGRYRIIDM